MNDQVVGLNGAGFYVGTLLRGMEEAGSAEEEFLIAVLAMQQRGKSAIDSLEVVVKQVVDQIENDRVIVISTGELFCIQVSGDEDNRKFSWQTGIDYDADKSVVQPLLARQGRFC